MKIIPPENFLQNCSLVGTNGHTKSSHPYDDRNVIHGGQNVLSFTFFPYNSLNKHYFV